MFAKFFKFFLQLEDVVLPEFLQWFLNRRLITYRVHSIMYHWQCLPSRELQRATLKD